MPARARASAIARPTRTAPPVTSARGRCGVILESVMSSRVKNWFKVRFIAGFFFTVPVFLTAWLLWIFWSRIDEVFVPTNNLYLGDVVVVPQDDVIATGLTVEEGIRIVLSAGNATPARLPRG